MKRRRLLPLLVALLSAGLAPDVPAQVVAGPLVQCVACHPTQKDAPHAVGPNLHGVFGAPVARAPGFVFSKSLRAQGGNWTEESLQQWLENPQAFAPGTKMAYAGLKDPAARQAVIDALKSLY